MSRLKTKTVISILTGLLLCNPFFLRAHDVMGPVAVNNILKSIQKSRLVLNSRSSQKDQEEAILNIGFQAHTLMKLINMEIQAHGTLQQGLIDLAVRRCREMGVGILYFEKTALYFYDFKEFEEYLKIAPQGQYVDEARFALIERSSYKHVAGEKPSEWLLQQVGDKKQFLREYPSFRKRAELEMLLTLDYYELYFIYLERRELKKSQQYKEWTLQLCRHIVEAFPDTEAANFARNLLIRLGL